MPTVAISQPVAISSICMLCMPILVEVSLTSFFFATPYFVQGGLTDIRLIPCICTFYGFLTSISPVCAVPHLPN